MKYKRENGRIVKDMGDVATEARAEQSRRVGLPPPGSVDRAMKKGGKALVEGGTKLAKAGMLGPVSKAPIVSDAVDAVKGAAKNAWNEVVAMRERNKNRKYDPRPSNPVTKAMHSLADIPITYGERERARDEERTANARAASQTGKPRPVLASTTKVQQKRMKK